MLQYGVKTLDNFLFHNSQKKHSQGLLAGMKLGGVAAVGGSLLGYAGATAIQDQVTRRSPKVNLLITFLLLLQQSTRDYIDSHYKSNPEVYVSSPRKDASAASPAARRKLQDGGSPRGSRRGSSPRSRRGSLLPPGEFPERRGSLVQVCRERREGTRRAGGNVSSSKENVNGSRSDNGRRERPRHLPCKADRAKAL